MEQDTVNQVLERVEASSFDAFECIQQIKINYTNIGVTHFLVQKLQRFRYSELEFYIPQLIQLLVSFESESMALSDFLINYSRKYPHFCLITFWHLQSYMYELKESPDSYSFHIVRSFLNDVQNIMFNQELENQSMTRFRENCQPALVLAGSIAASIAVPGLVTYSKPLVVSQSKQQKSFLFRLANFHKSLTRNLTLKNRAIAMDSLPGETNNVVAQSRHSEGSRPSPYSHTNLEDFDNSYSDTELLDRDININTKIRSKKSQVMQKRKSEDLVSLPRSHNHQQNPLASYSLPDLRDNDNVADDFGIMPVTSNNSSSLSLASVEQLEPRASSRHLQILDSDQKIKHLHVNYFKKETEFVMALQNISSRLSKIPKEARLTTLRAELTIINNTILPSEIDIPQLLPVSSQQNKRFHRILKLTVNEACVLNSAERVPFLLLIEYLSEEMDFDPHTEHNKAIILSKMTSDANLTSSRRVESLKSNSTVFNGNGRHSFDDEEDLGDASMVAISNERNLLARHLGPSKVSDISKSFSNYPEDDSNGVKYPSGGADEAFSTKDLSAQMRIAAVMLHQLEKTGQANSAQAASIKERIIESMKGLQDKFETIDYQQISEINSVNIGQTFPDAGERKLENDFKLGEDWQTKKDRIRKASAFGHLKNWELCSVIAKNGDDLPQEAFACQLISIISKIWKHDSVGVWTKNMKILVTSANSGLVETINNAMSVHSIKKSLTEISVRNGENVRGTVVSIKDYFIKVYGSETSSKYKNAQANFARSLAAYSIICYVLQIKDRHNGNIMLDNEGHIIHIDFGFLLSNTPGSVGFEAAPFKLTQEYVDVLGGFEGTGYRHFKDLCKASFKALRSSCDQLIDIVDLMLKDSSLPCFGNGAQTSNLLKQRLQLDLSDADCDNFVEFSLIGKSIGSVYTRLYDQFQLLTQGIYS